MAISCAALDDEARRMMSLAHDEAVRLGHEYVGTPHLTVVLLREQQSLPSRILRAGGVDMATLEAEVERDFPRRSPRRDGTVELPHTMGLRCVVSSAGSLAALHAQKAASPSHLLLAILSLPDVAITQALQRLPVDLRLLEARLREGMGIEPSGTPVVWMWLQEALSIPMQRATHRAQRVLAHAAAAATDAGRREVDGDHLLLGLVAEESGIAARILRVRGLELPPPSESMKENPATERGGEPEPPTGVTREFAGALQAAVRIAEEWGHQYVGTEHLLMGLLGTPSAPVDAWLSRARVTREELRHEVMEVLGVGAEP